MKTKAFALALAAFAMNVLGDAPGLAQPAEAPTRKPDVIYVPTPSEVVDAMLELAGVHDGDVLYDLGSGDGRIPVAAAKKFKVKAVGIEIDPVRIEEANANAQASGVTSEVSFATRICSRRTSQTRLSSPCTCCQG